MFLIGGGSMANGLTDALADKLGIDHGRVAVGGQEFMKNVDVGDRKLGPEVCNSCRHCGHSLHQYGV